MELSYHCAACQQPQRGEAPSSGAVLTCTGCGHTRTVSAESFRDGLPRCCLGCGNADLWRQKDFPQRLGLLMVALGAVLSSLAWADHRPVLALSILAGFALLDMLLYWRMPDVLVCYRCRARHRAGAGSQAFAPYNHELGERYRQERLRLEGHPAAR